jgi:membrane-associated protease RseP (regulator of RpoE activity)
MINMDMIGRLNDSTNKVIVYGVGTSPEWVSMIDHVQSSFTIKKDSAGIGPSDQTSFYLKNFPVLHFFTGQHSVYHKPTDDVAKINFIGEKKVLEYIIQIIAKTLELPKLKFLETRNTSSEPRKYKVTMGVMPDYAFDGKGMRIDGVTEGKPAYKAGVKKGDVVLKLGETKVESINDYMKALGAVKKGDVVEIIILREEKEIKLNVTF